MNQCKKKVIPWHVQQRYMESLSHLSLNRTISEAMYKKKIKSLQRNNKHLAAALNESRSLVTEKENLSIYNGKILDIINFSRVKLMAVATNMKQFTECLDETILLLNSVNSISNVNRRNDYKRKFQELNRNSPIKEVSENLESFNKDEDAESNAQKGKISRVDGCVSSPNKKCKLTKKERTVKVNCQNFTKSAKESSSTITTTGSKNTRVKNSKKFGSVLDIKSQNRKKSLPKNNIASASSSKPPSPSSNNLLQAKTKQESLDKKHKAVKVILTDIAETFPTQETENYFPVTNEPNSASSNPNFKCFSPNSVEDDILIKKYFSSDLTSKQSSSSNSCGSQFSTINDAKVSNTSQCSSISLNFSHKKLSDDNLEIDMEPSVLTSLKNEDFVCGQTSDPNKTEQIEGIIIAKQNNGFYIKKTDSEKDKRPYKSHNSKVTNKVHFYFDEDSIEKVEGNTIPPKDKIRKSINKCKARKTVSHKKKNIPSESTALKSNLILSDNISKLGKNSFLVTAEVHSPPNGISSQEIKSKMCNSEKMEPCVVLTDIFKSNQGLLSEMVGNSLRENGCLQKAITKSDVVPLAEINTTFAVNKDSGRETVNTFDVNKNSAYMNDVNSAVMDCENAENRCLPEDREIIRQGKHQRPRKIQSYKEPSLNVKMRRL